MAGYKPFGRAQVGGPWIVHEQDTDSDMAAPTTAGEFFRQGRDFDAIQVAVDIPAWVTGYELTLYRCIEPIHDGTTPPAPAILNQGVLEPPSPFTPGDPITESWAFEGILSLDQGLYVRLHDITGTPVAGQKIRILVTGYQLAG